jgi:hypothetical protein
LKTGSWEKEQPMIYRAIFVCVIAFPGAGLLVAILVLITISMALSMRGIADSSIPQINDYDRERLWRDQRLGWFQFSQIKHESWEPK